MITAFLNLKGGVGKTSTTFHLSGATPRSLVVDCDPQASLTQGFLGSVDVEPTIVGIYDESLLHLGQVLHRVARNTYLLPGSRLATPWNVPNPSLESLFRLRDALSESHFEEILIDCPPNLCFCSISALVAADRLIIPLQPEDFGAQGIAEVLATVEKVREINPRLQTVRFLLSMVQRWAIHRVYEAILREKYGISVLQTTIPRTKDFPEAVAARKPVGAYRPRSAAAKAIQALAEELEDESHRSTQQDVFTEFTRS
jgi:chromosome partitioning protein